jgi:hypothetical protein
MVLKNGMVVAPALLAVVAVFVSLAGCAADAPLVALPPGPVDSASVPSGAGMGDLVVYSATFAPTLEEGEYPAHTDYTVATAGDRIIERVMNRTGSFDKRPATVSLVSGQYHIRAQYSRGGFVTIPVLIEAGKTVTIDLEGRARPGGSEPIRLPDGSVVGWRTLVSR